MSGDRLGDFAKQSSVFCTLKTIHCNNNLYSLAWLSSIWFHGEKMRILHKKGWYD